MSKRSPEEPIDLVPRILDTFLEAPPAGTPAEIVAAFQSFCLGGAEPLSPHLLFQLVEQAPIAVSITDAHATILYANRTFEALTGYAREHIIGENHSILSSKATPDTAYADLWSAVNARRTWTGKLVNRKRSGASYLAEVTISPVLDRSGRITHCLGMHRDVTREHELARQVTHQKALLETVLDTAPVVVAVLDDQQRVLLDNQEYKKLLGDLYGSEPAEVLMRAAADQAGVRVPSPGVRGESFHNVEVRLEFASGGPRWYDCSAVFLDDVDQSVSSYFLASGRSAVCLFLASERTRQRREHERARMEHLRASLAEQQRIRELREAFAAASYQIQQPLNMINAATAMLRGNSEGNDQLLQVLEEVGASAARAVATLRTALPAEDEEPLQHLNLNQIVKEVLEMFTERLLKNGIVVAWRPSSVLPVINGRATQLRGMLMNIVDNAIVALGEGRTAHRELEVRTAAGNGGLTVTVQDNGPGIPSGDRLTVFHPLYCGWKTKARHTGMGLAMAQEIAVRHGGGIHVDEAFEDGCRVQVELPVGR